MNGKISNFQQIASVRKYTYNYGKEKDIQVIDCDNGKTRFLLNVSKALDIMQVYVDGKNVSFLSKNAFTNQTKSFSTRFEGGMLYTCGLDNIGNHQGYELHGTLHNTTATVSEMQCDESGIEIKAEISSTELFGRNLVLKRKITSKINSAEIKIEDTLCNMAYREEKYCLLYHVNLGYPFLDGGNTVILQEKECKAYTPIAIERFNDRLVITDNVDNQDEMCYHYILKEPKVSVENKKINKRFIIEYSGDTLPYFVEWKSMASGDYALGLEPTTSDLLEQIEYKTIEAQQEVKFTLLLKIEDIK